MAPLKAFDGIKAFDKINPDAGYSNNMDRITG
jgi:hypothetical protein